MMCGVRRAAYGLELVSFPETVGARVGRFDVCQLGRDQRARP